MQDLEKKVESAEGEKTGNDVKKEASSGDSYYKPKISLGAEPFAVSSILLGTFISFSLEGLYTKVFGGTCIAGGIITLWACGYSPIKMSEEIFDDIGKVVCYPYDYIKKRYKRKEN